MLFKSGVEVESQLFVLAAQGIQLSSKLLRGTFIARHRAAFVELLVAHVSPRLDGLPIHTVTRGDQSAGLGDSAWVFLTSIADAFIDQVGAGARRRARVRHVGFFHVPQKVRYGPKLGGAGAAYVSRPGRASNGWASTSRSRSNGPSSPSLAAVSASSTWWLRGM